MHRLCSSCFDFKRKEGKKKEIQGKGGKAGYQKKEKEKAEIKPGENRVVVQTTFPWMLT